MAQIHYVLVGAELVNHFVHQFRQGCLESRFNCEYTQNTDLIGVQSTRVQISL